MPAIGVNSNRPAAIPPPPKPQVTPSARLNPGPAPAPSAPGFLGNVGRSLQGVAQNVAYSPPKSGGSDAATSGPGYGSATANAYKSTPSYAKVVVDVFRHQSPVQQHAILQGAQRYPTIEGKIALQYHAFQTKLASVKEGSGVDHFISTMFQHAAGDYGGKAASGEGGTGSLATVGNPGYGKIATNAGKDLINLPAETISTVGTIGGDVLSGRPGKAVSDFVSPFVQTAEHPISSFLNHPLNTYLMTTGALHGASRLAAAPVRALAPDSALGRAVSTQREGVALTGNLTHERPPFSKSPTVKAQQAAVDKLLYTKAPTGELVTRDTRPGAWLRRRQINTEVGQLVGARERIRAVNRDQVRATRAAAVRPSTIRRAGSSAKNALKIGPHTAVIPGAEVLSLIADGTVRRADTIVADLQKHLDIVKANRSDLAGDPQALKANAAYVKVLEGALKNKAFLKNPAPAFEAASKYAKDYAPVEAKAAALGHFGDMGKEALQRRALMHYAQAHMGARVDPEFGMVVDRAVAGAKGKTEPVKLSNDAILSHLKGPEGTGGRLPAYTSDRVRFDREKAKRQANYVSDARRPLPVTQKNTLYAHTHGLTNPAHDALAEQHALMQGVVDSHHSQNTYLDTLATRLPGGKYGTYEEARRAAPEGYQPINVSQPFHAKESLDKAMQGVAPAAIEEEAMRRSLDLAHRLQPSKDGRWAIIDEQALKTLKDHQNQISPNALLRTIRGLNNQFRTVALSTSAKHIPGVMQENLIRDIANGVGFRSWVSGRRILEAQKKISPDAAHEFRVRQTGGQVAGMTEAQKTYMVSDHWQGTTAYPFLKAFEAAAKVPGPKQLRFAWKAWSHFAIHTTKRLLEEQHQIAGLGKHVLREHGYVEAAKVDGMMGLIHRAFGIHGQMLDDAAKGLFDPKKEKQARAVVQQIYGKWTDLSPSGQTALMFSPFGLWWVNSAKFIARSPVDRPVLTAAQAGATEGTQQERQANGLDMFMGSGQLPGYEQGGIAAGGKIYAQNYYSPYGIANDPLATGQSLIQPWLTGPAVLSPLGLNWLGKPLNSPTDPHGRTAASFDQRAQAFLDNVLSSFMPLYTKAKQIAEGGSSAYDTNGKGILPFPVATKTPGKGPGTGLKKSLQPFRTYAPAPPSGGGSGGVSFGSGGGGGAVIPGSGSAGGAVIP